MRGPDVVRFLRGVVRNNPWQKVFALLLSVLLWWFVTGENKVQVGIVVPIEIRNVPPGTAVTNKVERQAEVRLSGPSSLLSKVTPQELSVSVDLSAARSGRQVIALNAEAVRVPPGIKVQRVYPQSVEVVLARLERRSVPVVPRVGGTASVRRRIARVEVEPRQVLVEGPADVLDRLGRLFTEEVVPDAEGREFTASARVDLREGHAKIVGDPAVRVTVHFRE